MQEKSQNNSFRTSFFFNCLLDTTYMFVLKRFKETSFCQCLLSLLCAIGTGD